jgi:hypothetical protein
MRNAIGIGYQVITLVRFYDIIQIIQIVRRYINAPAPRQTPKWVSHLIFDFFILHIYIHNRRIIQKSLYFNKPFILNPSQHSNPPPPRANPHTTSPDCANPSTLATRRTSPRRTSQTGEACKSDPTPSRRASCISQ